MKSVSSSPILGPPKSNFSQTKWRAWKTDCQLVEAVLGDHKQQEFRAFLFWGCFAYTWNGCWSLFRIYSCPNQISWKNEEFKSYSWKIFFAIFWFSYSIRSSSSFRALKCSDLALYSIDVDDADFTKPAGLIFTIVRADTEEMGVIATLFPEEISTSFFKSF